MNKKIINKKDEDTAKDKIVDRMLKLDKGIGSLLDSNEKPVNQDAISLLDTSHPYVTFENEDNARNILYEWMNKNYNFGGIIPWSACVTLSDLTNIDARNIQKLLVNENDLVIKSKALKNSILKELLTVELISVDDQLNFVKYLQGDKSDGAIIDFNYDPLFPLSLVKDTIKDSFNEIKECYIEFWQYMPYLSIDRLEHLADWQKSDNISRLAQKKMRLFYGNVHEFHKNPNGNFGKTKIFVISLVDQSTEKIRYVPDWSNFITRPPSDLPPF